MSVASPLLHVKATMFFLKNLFNLIVIIMLITCNQVMHSHYQSLGGWSFELVGYWEEQMMAFINEPEMTEILTQVDINSELQLQLSVTLTSSF